MILYNDHHYMIEKHGIASNTYHVHVRTNDGWLYWRDFTDDTATYSHQARVVAEEWMRSFLTHPATRSMANADN
jgi:hypothetical protein